MRCARMCWLRTLLLGAWLPLAVLAAEPRRPDLDIWTTEAIQNAGMSPDATREMLSLSAKTRGAILMFWQLRQELIDRAEWGVPAPVDPDAAMVELAARYAGSGYDVAVPWLTYQREMTKGWPTKEARSFERFLVAYRNNVAAFARGESLSSLPALPLEFVGSTLERTVWADAKLLPNYRLDLRRLSATAEEVLRASLQRSPRDHVRTTWWSQHLEASGSSTLDELVAQLGPGPVTDLLLLPLVLMDRHREILVPEVTRLANERARSIVEGTRQTEQLVAELRKSGSGAGVVPVAAWPQARPRTRLTQRQRQVLTAIADAHSRCRIMPYTSTMAMQTMIPRLVDVIGMLKAAHDDGVFPGAWWLSIELCARHGNRAHIAAALAGKYPPLDKCEHEASKLAWGRASMAMLEGRFEPEYGGQFDRSIDYRLTQYDTLRKVFAPGATASIINPYRDLRRFMMNDPSAPDPDRSPKYLFDFDLIEAKGLEKTMAEREAELAAALKPGSMAHDTRRMLVWSFTSTENPKPESVPVLKMLVDRYDSDLMGASARLTLMAAYNGYFGDREYHHVP